MVLADTVRPSLHQITTKFGMQPPDHSEEANGPAVSSIRFQQEAHQHLGVWAVRVDAANDFNPPDRLAEQGQTGV